MKRHLLRATLVALAWSAFACGGDDSGGLLDPTTTTSSSGSSGAAGAGGASGAATGAGGANGGAGGSIGAGGASGANGDAAVPGDGPVGTDVQPGDALRDRVVADARDARVDSPDVRVPDAVADALIDGSRCPQPCPGGRPLCDPSSGQCVECVTDGDCMDPGKPGCLPSTHRCEDCSGDQHCPMGTHCNLMEGKCR